MGECKYIYNCNPGWELLESTEARYWSQQGKGAGWRRFRQLLLQERGATCEPCGRSDLASHDLHLHHLKTIRTHRHLRFERSNIVICCQACHNSLEHGGRVQSKPSTTENPPHAAENGCAQLGADDTPYRHV